MNNDKSSFESFEQKVSEPLDYNISENSHNSVCIEKIQQGDERWRGNLALSHLQTMLLNYRKQKVARSQRKQKTSKATKLCFYAFCHMSHQPRSSTFCPKNLLPPVVNNTAAMKALF
jgi:hypothetical protein